MTSLQLTLVLSHICLFISVASIYFLFLSHLLSKLLFVDVAATNKEEKKNDATLVANKDETPVFKWQNTPLWLSYSDVRNIRLLVSWQLGKRYYAVGSCFMMIAFLVLLWSIDINMVN